MNDNNYITIQGWMKNKLHLKGAELLTFAVIYGFSQDGKSSFSGTLGYLSDWVGVSKQSLCVILKKLTEKEFIKKSEKNINGVIVSEYQVNLTLIQKTLTPIKETLTPIKETLTTPVKETLTPSLLYNKYINIYNNNNIDFENFESQDETIPDTEDTPTPAKSRKFIPPTLQECISYAKELYCWGDLGEEFYNYYIERDWVDGGGKPVKNWKNKMQTWKNKNKDKYIMNTSAFILRDDAYWENHRQKAKPLREIE